MGDQEDCRDQGLTKMTLPLETVIPAIVFLVMTLGSWIVLGAIAERPQTAADRLKRLVDPAAARGAAEATQARRQQQLQAKVAAAASRVGKSLRPTDDEELGKIRLRLLNAGFRQEQAVAVYYGAKLFGLLSALAISFPPLVFRFGMAQMAYIVAAAIAGLGFYLPDFLVDRRRKRRQESIFLGLPDALDLMVVCVEAGLGLDAAMRRVTSELADSAAVLCEEFGIANFQLQMGRPRKEVLRDLGIRTGVEDVRSLAAVIIQAEKFGSSVAAALRVQSDAMRLRRRQLAEEKAAQTSVKIMIPLIFFIFPGVFVVLVGPAALQLARTFFK
jgi:tight adherence protein C